jgi:hypothetical protein
MVIAEQAELIVPVVVFEDKNDTQPRPYHVPWPSLAQRLCTYDERSSKDGRAWSPVTYRPGTTRGKANVDQVHALVLDVDHQALPLDLLEGLEYTAHTTFSHSASDPRWRVILPLASSVDGSDWPAFWLRANAHFGGCVDPATKDSSRIFYLPSCQPGGLHEVRQQHGTFLESISLPDIPRYEPSGQPVVIRRLKVAAPNYLHGWAERFAESKVDDLAGMHKDTGRNTACNRTAYLLGGLAADDQHGLDVQWIVGALYAACQRNGLVADDGQRSVEATIRSGLEAGLARAWSPADQEEIRPIPRSRTNGHVEQVAPPDGPRLSIVRMSDVRPEPIEWLWRGRLARGKATLLMGDPGLGKSLISHWVCAICSRGGEWPDGGTCEQGTAILFTIEDGLEDTVAPRLLAADANMDNVIAVRGVIAEDTTLPERMFALTEHIAQLEALIVETRAIVVVMDPISAYLGPDVNSHRESDVRAVLGPLQLMAERTRVVLVMLMHLNKGTGVSALYRATGSIAFPAVARVVLGVAPDPNDEDGKRRLLLPVKMNIGRGGEGIGYRIETAPHTSVLPKADAADQPPILLWDLEPVTIDATSAMDRNGSPAEMSALEETKQALIQILIDGRVLAADCKRQLRESVGGASETTLARARKELGVRVRKDGFQGAWWWELTKDPSRARKESLESLKSLEPMNHPSKDPKDSKDPKESKEWMDGKRARAHTDRCRRCGREEDLHGARDPISCQWEDEP